MIDSLDWMDSDGKKAAHKKCEWINQCYAIIIFDHAQSIFLPHESPE